MLAEGRGGAACILAGRPGRRDEGPTVPTLRLLTGPSTGGHGGEAFACCYTPDGGYVLSGGWDGHLRLWEAATGQPLTSLRAGAKPVSACAVSPDGTHWISGALDGMLTCWDAMSQTQRWLFLAHTRPVSAILFTPHPDVVVTTSWDRTVAVWRLGLERDKRVLEGHGDIVAGCRFNPDGRRLLSWSHDGTLRLWDPNLSGPLTTFSGHKDRITAAAVSPDGQWAASASRDRVLKLWDLNRQREMLSLPLGDEIRACLFLLDGETLVAIDAHGVVTLHALPGLERRERLATRLAVQCAELSPSGHQIALGCGDGRVHFVSVDGFDSAPLLVTPTEAKVRTTTVLQRLFGGSKVTKTYRCTCPVCRQAFTLPTTALGQPAPCPHCQRRLRLSTVTRLPEEV
jgi:WD40 repeat protein